MGLSISIIMTFWNRKTQLSNTLKSIEQYGHKIPIIIIDDASTDGEDIHCFENDLTRVVTLKDKKWINPCIPFNTGFAMATTDIVLIQNAECIHVGDIIGHALANARENVYLNYSALAVNQELTEKITKGDNIKEVIAPHIERNVNQEGSMGNGWYNHPRYRAVMYHFCSAIMRSDLYDLGGFDERYADGSGYDDDELLHRIQQKRMNIEMIEYPFVVHQHHAPFYAGEVISMMGINAAKFFNETKKSSNFDVKRYNKIYK
jgi:glycosyltransferase involved in cell wall biosynthesis